MNRNRRDDLAFAAAQAQGNEPDLPTVDDLEVAALAAAAGMSDSQTSSETSSSEAEDDDEGDSSESESGRSDANAPAAERVQLQLNFNGMSSNPLSRLLKKLTPHSLVFITPNVSKFDYKTFI